ncbi:MAG: hypothetical protein ILA19_00800 [Bacilli bacterium]|nr:hypothetical protein [Bacilli bacterium]
MDTLILVLKVMLYISAIVLLVVLAILGIKAIGVMDKTDKLLDDVDEKVKSLDNLFLAVDKVGYGINKVTDTITDRITNFVGRMFKRKRKDD